MSSCFPSFSIFRMNTDSNLTFEGFTAIMQDEEDDGCCLSQSEEPLSPGTVQTFKQKAQTYW